MSLLAYLNRVLTHSTPVGRAWLPVLFIIRVLVAFIAETSVWKNEESFFVCISHEPGCGTVCFNHYLPITHPQYWFLQLTVVTAPTLLLIAYSLTQPKGSNATYEGKIGMEPTQEGTSLSKRYYILSILFKLILESGFVVGQWYLIGFHVSELFVCRQRPCSHLVSCMYPNAFKKTLFIIFMLSLTGISILLLILEVTLLVARKFCKCRIFHPIRHSNV